MQVLTENFFDEIKTLPFESSTAGRASGFENGDYRERKFNKRKVRLATGHNVMYLCYYALFEISMVYVIIISC